MNLLGIAKKQFEQLTRTHIYRSLPRGIDLVKDIANALPMFQPEIFFDVGANVGQSATLYLDQYPTLQVYCFEPVDDTFRQLEKNLAGHKHIECYSLALGSSTFTGKMVLEGSSDRFFLLEQSNEAVKNDDVVFETVNVIALDEFCQTKRIEHISILKIDAEGGDLDVLKGAVKMLSGQKIDLVQVEAAMNPRNSRHISLEILKAFLESHRYFLFGIYEQVNEWLSNEPHLRRTNLVFISQRMIEMNTRTNPPGA